MEINPLVLRYRKQAEFKGMPMYAEGRSGNEEMSFETGSLDKLVERLTMIRNLGGESFMEEGQEPDSVDIWIHAEAKKSLPEIEWQTESGHVVKLDGILKRLCNAAINENYPFGVYYEYNDNDFSRHRCTHHFSVDRPTKDDKMKAIFDTVAFIKQLPVQPKRKRSLLVELASEFDIPEFRQELKSKDPTADMDVEVDLD